MIFYLEDLVEFLKIIFASMIIAEFCQNVKDTPNQERIIPSNQASNMMLTVTITAAVTIMPIVVEVFIDNFLL